MSVSDKFLVTNIRRYLNSDNPKLGEDRLLHEISEFSCPKNPDVENFLKNNAVEFTKKSQSVTYFVYSLESKRLVGYFSIALKSLTVRGEMVSKTVKKKLLRISELDENLDTYNMSAYLIAQLAKNYTNDCDKEITGAELIELAWMAGGVVAFLEAEPREKLLSFYQTNRFQQFDTRQTTSSEEQHELVQLLRLL